ncbi:MAG: DUF2461 domain-containing protein [Vulcanimicrobiaceae bacterium]
MAATVRTFEGFSDRGLRLLAALARNNERAWFATRKARFEAELFSPMRALVADATRALGRAKIALGGDAKRSIFRIYRDVRFGHDKSPYRTHLAAYLSYDGGRATPGGVYIHIEPARSFLSIAFYRIERPMLQRWRTEMAGRPERFLRVVRSLERNGLALEGPERSEDALARVARGFEAHAASEIAPYLRLRSFCADRTLVATDVRSPELVERIVETARAAKPLLAYGWPLQ